MSWACERCTLEQSDRRRACGACGGLRPDLLRACFPDVKTQKRPKATSAVGGAKGGAANARGVWSNLPLPCGMVSLPQRPRTAANPCDPNCRCLSWRPQACSDKYGREGEGHGGGRRAWQLGCAANYHGRHCSLPARRRTASAVSSTAPSVAASALALGLASRLSSWLGRGGRQRGGAAPPPEPALAPKRLLCRQTPPCSATIATRPPHAHIG